MDNLIKLLPAVSILSSVLTSHISSSQIEVSSEASCWIVLSSISVLWKSRTVKELFDLSTPTPPPSDSALRSTPRRLWVAAICVSAHGFCKGEGEVVKFVPILAPLLLLAQQRISSGHTEDHLRDLKSNFSARDKGMIVVSFIAVFSIQTWNFLEYAYSTGAVTSILLACANVLPRASGEQSWTGKECLAELLRLAPPAAVTTASMLVFEIIRYGLPPIAMSITLGLLKAVSWFCMLQMAYIAGWPILGAIATFSIMMTRDPSEYRSMIYNTVHYMIAAVSVVQMLQMLPRRAVSKSVLLFVAMLCLVPQATSIFRVEQARCRSLAFDENDVLHPVEQLAAIAEEEYHSLLERQSGTLLDAEHVYRRKYKVEPPPGFDDWYEYAIDREAIIIDDYDLIHRAVSPFLRLSGREVVELQDSLRQSADSDLWFCQFLGNEKRVVCEHPLRTNDRNFANFMSDLVGNIPGHLPDISFLVNHLDEPRVVIPPKSKDDNAPMPQRPQTANRSHRPAWDNVTTFCSVGIGDETANTSASEVNTFGLPFLKDLKSSKDLCRHPEYVNMHGFLQSPTSFHLIKGLVPVWSAGSLSTMGDIPFPSPAYADTGFRYDGSADSAWADKRQNVYWAGSNTGGFAAGQEWLKFHRQRFLDLTQGWSREVPQYLGVWNGSIARVQSFILQRWQYDVALTRVSQCEAISCRNQMRHFSMKSWQGKDDMFRSQLVFDLDGNGISGRWNKLVASKSTPLKQTLFSEWHDERLVPWYHYIPVSMSMGELPELIQYLTSTKKGQRLAEEIASHGHVWTPRALRKVDMSIYVYRLLLELARLQDPQRPADPREQRLMV